MELYNISAMAAILDMQISWFSSATREIHQKVFRIFFYENFMNIATGERLSRSWTYKLAHGGHV